MSERRLEKLAEVLVRYSTGVRRGELVSLHGPVLAEPLITTLYRQVLRAGGHPAVYLAPEACARILLQEGSPEQLSFLNPLDVREVEAVDVAIHVLASENTRALTNIDPSKQALRSKARRPAMDIFLRRAAEQSLRWVATPFPCQANAQEAEMALEEYSDFVFGAGMLDHPDPAAVWQRLSQQQARVVDFLHGIRELRFVTPGGSDLKIGIAGRTWINCDGHENFPDGEVFTGPLEDGTEGTVCFDFPTVHGGREVQGVRLKFRAGRVVDASAAKGEEFLVRMLDQDAGARILGEVALGCNYSITRHTRNTLFDEKIGGTFHVALGSAYPESGGKNHSALHWDMVCDLRRGGRIEADGRLISENGRFVNSDWPQP
ncbi:MAG TPA: aminopeptidase [Gemmataceae bacterium]|nr:aminopeptidase [Gemmataceae bacterium]